MKPIQYPDHHVAHYITFSCKERRALINTEDHFIIILEALEKYRLSKEVKIFAYVIMPNHLHLLMQFPENLAPSEFLRVFKRTTSYRLLRWYEDYNPSVLYSLHYKDGKHIRKQFWQRGCGYDRHVEGNPDSIRTICEYIHGNPVRKGLVENPEDWQWSSTKYWLQNVRGIVEITSPFE